MTRIPAPLRRLLLGLVLLGTNESQAQSPEPADWQSDVDTLIARMEATHPNLYAHHSRAEWDEAASRLHRALPEMSRPEAFGGFARLAAMAGDGHTGLVPPMDVAFLPFYPLTFAFFSDGLYVTDAPEAHVDLFGKRIESINGMPVSEVVGALRPYVSAGNEARVYHQVPFLLQVPALLTVAGVADALDAPLRLAVAGGDEFAVNAASRMAPPATVPSSPSAGPALHREVEGNVGFEHLESSRALYLRVRRVRDNDGEAFASVVRRAFATADSLDTERVVIDLRGNPGGNNYLGQPLLHALIRSAADRPGGLFVLTDRGTFSAAVNLAADIERHTHAVFVGEPTGAPPNHAGDPEQVTLAASGLVVQVSDLYWQGSDPRDARPWIYPDVPVAVSYSDFAAGNDPVLQAALDYEGGAEETLRAPNENWNRPGQDTAWQVIE